MMKPVSTKHMFQKVWYSASPPLTCSLKITPPSPLSLLIGRLWGSADELESWTDLLFLWVDESELGSTSLTLISPASSPVWQLMLRCLQDNAIPAHRRLYCYSDDDAGKIRPFSKLLCRCRSRCSSSRRHLSNSDWISGVVLTRPLEKIGCASASSSTASSCIHSVVFDS